jgi:hypothetical protein
MKMSFAALSLRLLLLLQLLSFPLGLQLSVSKSTHQHCIINRRQALAIGFGGAIATTVLNVPLAVADENLPAYESRDRRSNSDAVIREDYWYMTGRIPPRNLREAQLTPEDPQWNAFGSCLTSADGSSTNSCTYVPLRQRIPAYSKYAYNIALGAKEYQQVGDLLRKQLQLQQSGGDSNLSSSWQMETLSYLQSSSSSPPPTKDSLLKMVLLASGLLTSPNFSGPNRELLVARFYVNEVRFALAELIDALQQSDLTRAIQAWEFGRDHWNSYFVIVNRHIVPKVGETFERIV